jgi:hypothetical protein
LLLDQTEQPIEVPIRTGYNMNINDKINVLNIRINLLQYDISEHLRILEEDALQDGDEQVIRKSLSDLYMSLNAIEEHLQVLTNSLEMI